MIIELATRNPRSSRPQGALRAHAIGLLGANLTVGPLIILALPLLGWDGFSLRDGVSPLNLLYDALLLATMVAGVGLMEHAAHMIGEDEA